MTRRFPVAVFLALVVVDLALLLGLGVLLTRGHPVRYAGPTSVSDVWRSITVPVGVSLLLVIVVVAALRWWWPVLVEEQPVAQWVGVIPIIMLVAVLLSINYVGLSDRGLGFTLLLLLSTMFVGFAEEGMFRGIGLTVFRINGFAEGRAALWTTVIFGLAHATNLISTGPRAFVQVLVAALSGYFLYLARRATRGLLVPAVLHGLWDFSLISNFVIPDQTRAGPFANIVALVAVTVLVLVRRQLRPV